MTAMVAYHGDEAVKAKYLERVRAHRAADHLIQGTGWEDGKGCAVGCTLENYDHSRYPIELGVPLELACLEDAIFEGLPKAEAMEWPERFLSAIHPGADLAMVWSRFALWLLEVELGKYPTSAPVAALHRRRLVGDEPTAREWDAASAAWDAASAAWAARDAARAAASAAACAAAAWDAAAWDAASAAAWNRFADKLVELLEAAR